MYKFSCSKQKICCIYSGTWELGTPKGLRKTVLNSEVVLFLRSICVYWMGLGTWVAVLNSQVVPISQVVAKTGFAVHDNRNYSHFLCIINSAVVFNELFQNTVIYSDIYLSHLFVNFMPLLPLLSNSHKVISFGMCQTNTHAYSDTTPVPPPLESCDTCAFNHGTKPVHVMIQNCSMTLLYGFKACMSRNITWSALLSFKRVPTINFKRSTLILVFFNYAALRQYCHQKKYYINLSVHSETRNIDIY